VSTQGSADTCPTISGYVYNDANNNGIKDSGEAGIAGNTLQLKNAQGTVVATATTDSNGHYVFSTDATISQSDQTKTQTLTFPTGTTNWSQSQQLAQFDPNLGTLTSIEIVNQGTISSHIRVENLDQAAATVDAQVSGTLVLTGPGLTGTPLAATQLSAANAEQTFQAQSFDGTTDYTGGSGHDFGTKTATGSQSFTITDPTVLAQYTGSGSVTLTEMATATSSATGNGNLQSLINSTAGAQVSVIYHYQADNCLKPGNYTIVQTATPDGFIDGQLTAGNTAPIPNSAGTHTISVTLGSTDSTNNNFGEIKAASLAGFVYVDANNDGIKQSSEQGISGVQVSLSGTDDLGNDVALTQTTGADGSYRFANLRPGNYSLKEGTDGYLDGKDTIGSQGGTADTDQFSNINLASGVAGVNNNFGEIQPASVSGFVYVDANNNGIKDPNEAPIPNVAVTLTGTDDQGNSVSLSTTSAADGSYKFANLRPGTYTIAEPTQPTNFQDGKDTIGSLGGTAGNDQFIVNLNAGNQGVNYNFGELPPPAPAVTSLGTPDQTTQQDPGVVTKRDSLILFWHRRGIQTTVDSL
jgi:hypothetical protein